MVLLALPAGGVPVGHVVAKEAICQAALKTIIRIMLFEDIVKKKKSKNSLNRKIHGKMNLILFEARVLFLFQRCQLV